MAVPLKSIGPAKDPLGFNWAVGASHGAILACSLNEGACYALLRQATPSPKFLR